MKLIIDSAALNKALKIISPAIKANSVIHLTQSVLVDVQKSECLITAIDLGLTITQKVNCESVEKFKAVLPFLELRNIVSVLPTQPITIEVSDKLIEVRTNEKSWKLGKSEDVKNFPNIPMFEPQFEFDADSEFLYHLQLATNCTSKDTNQIHFTNVCIELKDSCVKLLSTDGLQLFQYERNFKKGEKQMCVDIGFIKALKAIESGKLESGGNFLKVSTDETTIIGILSEQKFPDTAMFFQPYEHNCSIIRSALLTAINELMVFKSDLYMVVLNFEKKDKISIKFNDYDFEQSFETEIDAVHSVDIKQIAFNGTILKNLLTLIPDTEEIKLSITNEKALVHLDPFENKDLKLIILPMFLN
jgi:DNA polymerase III sliding clamp (beta) subunit (PCNA family)